MIFQAIFDPNTFRAWPDSLIVSLIAILIVFAVLAIVIGICSIFQAVINKIESKKHILPREENKILDEDEDAAVATIVASIDFYKETKQNARVVRVTKDGK